MARKKDKAICSECGDDGNLLEHPSYSGDRLCKECLVSWHESEIDDLESEIRSHKEEVEKINKS
jgi:hypothetical protein